MTLLDYFVLTVVLASVASGAIKGILRGTISTASTLAGLFAAMFLYPWTAKPFSLVMSETASNLVGFILVFIAVLVAGALLVRSLRGGLKRVRLGWLDHAGGAVFGLLRAWIICSVVYLALTAFPIRLSAVEHAMFAPVLLEGTRVIAYATSPQMRDKFMEGYGTVTKLWTKERQVSVTGATEHRRGKS
jgi:membrane protein required for colicin V production